MTARCLFRSAKNLSSVTSLPPAVLSGLTTSISEKFDNWIATGLLVALFFATLAHGAVEPWSLAIFEVMLIGLLLLWGIKATRERRLELNIPAAAFPIAALAVVAIAQSIAFTATDGHRLSLSMDVEATRQSLLLLLLLMFAFIAAVNSLQVRERLSRLANILTFFGTALALFALIQYLTWNGNFYWVRPANASVFGPFVNRNHFAGFMAMLIPFPLALMLNIVRGQARFLYGFAASVMGTAAIVSNSRSGIISIVASLLFMMLLRKLSVASILIVGAAMVGSVLWLGAAPIVEHFGEAVDQLVHSGAPDVGRLMIWNGTLNMVRHHPVLGVGLGAFVSIYPTYETQPASVLINYAHNDYLQILSECGIVGGIIAASFIGILLFGIYRGVAMRDPLRSAMSLAAGAGIVAILIQSVSDTDLQVPSNALLFLILVALVTGSQEPAITVGAVCDRAPFQVEQRAVADRAYRFE